MSTLWIKKLLVAFISPLNLSLCMLSVGILLFFVKRCRKMALTSSSAGLLILVLAGYGLFNENLKKIETRYGPLKNVQTRLQDDDSIPEYVVVLGSGHVSDPKLPATSQINSDSLFRLVEGIRIYRSIPEAKLYLSGGPGFDTISNATVMATVAKQIGIPEKDMIIESKPSNTEEEAVRVRQRLKKAHFIMVTSGAHMPRAVDIFHKQGMTPIPAPTDFIFKERKTFSPHDLFVSPNNIALTERVLYENLGKLWFKLKGSAGVR